MPVRFSPPLASLNPWRSLRGLPPQVWVVCAAMLINRSGTMVLPFLALYLTQWLGLPPSRAGIVLAAFGAGGLAAAPLGGWLSDRVGAVRVMVGALVSSGLLLALFPFVTWYGALVALTAAWAVLSEAARPATLVALTDRLAPDKRKAAIALNRLALNLGFGIGPAVGGLLASTSFALLFWIDAATAVAAGAFLAVAARRMGMGRPAPAGGPAEGASRTGGLVPALRDPRMGGLLLGAVLAFLVFEQHRSTLPLHVTDGLGLSASFYGSLFLVNVALILVFEVPLNLATARWPHGRTLALGAALIALGFGATGLARGPLGVALSVAVWTFGEMLLFPGLAAYVVGVAPEARRGAYMGAYGLATWAALIPAPLLGTLLLERVGPGALWTAALGVGLVAALAFASLGWKATPAPTEAA